MEGGSIAGGRQRQKESRDQFSSSAFQRDQRRRHLGWLLSPWKLTLDFWLPKPKESKSVLFEATTCVTAAAPGDKSRACPSSLAQPYMQTGDTVALGIAF